MGFPSSFDHHDDFAAHLARTQPADCLTGSLQWKAFADRGLDPTLTIERHQRRYIRGMLRGKAIDELAPVDTDDLTTLEQRQVERRLRNTGREANDEVSPLPADGAQRRFGVIAAH